MQRAINETIRKRVRLTGRQCCIAFSKEETKCYHLKPGQIISISIITILEEKA